jgi:hypothetical protein
MVPVTVRAVALAAAAGQFAAHRSLGLPPHNPCLPVEVAQAAATAAVPVDDRVVWHAGQPAVRAAARTTAAAACLRPNRRAARQAPAPRLPAQTLCRLSPRQVTAPPRHADTPSSDSTRYSLKGCGASAAAARGGRLTGHAAPRVEALPVTARVEAVPVVPHLVASLARPDDAAAQLQ